MKKVLTIAGSDSSGGAGIQADIKTISAHGLYAMSAITALTAQNTTGVYAVSDVPADFVAKQIDCVFEDIRPDAVKIGMVLSSAIIEAIADRLRFYEARNIVLDPVMVATSGGRLIASDAQKALVNLLFPLADVVTPNIPEAETLSGIAIESESDMERAARAIARLTKAAVLVKGGHLASGADDLLYYKGRALWLRGERIDNPNTHGTGCTLSSAIACGLAVGDNLLESVDGAKKYVAGALSMMLNLGKGSGPMDHMFVLRF